MRLAGTGQASATRHPPSSAHAGDGRRPRRRRPAALLVAALIAGAAACGPGEARNPSGDAASRADDRAVPEVDSAEYAVLSALLRQEVLKPGRSYVLISDSTRTEWGGGGTPNPARTAAALRLPEFVISNFLRISERAHPLRPAFSLPGGSRLMDAAAVDSLMRSGTGSSSWVAFPRRHPGAAGLAFVSRVAFTPSGKTAVANYNLVCGPLCGEGALVRLDLIGDEWKVTAHAARRAS